METKTTTSPNWRVYGHEWAVAHLRKAIVHERTRHAYLITGIDAIGKRTLAYHFAMALNAPHPGQPGNIDYDASIARRIMSGNHPDIILSQLDDKTGALKIEQVREISTRLALKPYEARCRVAILDDFQNARGEAQDALLKTLEEPAQTAVLLVLTRNTEGILSTITSRCQVLNLRPPALDTVRTVLEREHGLAPPDADLVARVSGGRIGWAIAAAQPDNPALDQRNQALDLLEDTLTQRRPQRFALADDLAKDKLAVLPLLELWLTYWRDLLLVVSGADLPLTNIDREASLHKLAQLTDLDAATLALNVTRGTLRTLQHTNTNTRLALEVMFLDYPEMGDF
jgi:DNA polymerase III subunit delta'